MIHGKTSHKPKINYDYNKIALKRTDVFRTSTVIKSMVDPTIYSTNIDCKHLTSK